MTGHDELHAEDAVIHVPAARYLKCVEADLNWALAELGRKSKRTRGPSTFTQAAVTRAVKGVQATGAPVGRVEVTKDKITVEVGKAEDGDARDARVVAMDRIAAMRGGRK
jgi:hypothetical protein